MSTSERVRIVELIAGTGDSGHSSPPGGGMSEKTVTLYATARGDWRAEGEVRTGNNQGYFQVNYEYGPWKGRGDTPEEAVEHMLRRVDDEWTDDIRKAAHDALLDADGDTFATLALAEAERIEGVIAAGEREGCRKATVGDVNHYADTVEERMEIRRSAVASLRKLAQKPDPALANVSDESLRAEMARRGLST